jgi:hypothetical protein
MSRREISLPSLLAILLRGSSHAECSIANWNPSCSPRDSSAKAEHGIWTRGGRRYRKRRGGRATWRESGAKSGLAWSGLIQEGGMRSAEQLGPARNRATVRSPRARWDMNAFPFPLASRFSLILAIGERRAIMALRVP